MKYQFAFFILIFVLISCNQTPTPVDIGTEPVSQVLSSNSHFASSEIKSDDFNLIKGDSLQKLLIQQFCEESKGYQKDIWLGLNQCSWAIEKYRIDQNPDIIQRNGKELSIFLPNSEKKSFIHDNDDSKRAIYYQFKKYLPTPGYVVLEKMKEQDCVEHLFVRLKDGQQTNFSGIPYFSPSGNSFLLNGKGTKCLSNMEFWEITGDKFTKKWTEDLASESIRDIKWINQGGFATHLASQTSDRFLNFKLH